MGLFTRACFQGILKIASGGSLNGFIKGSSYR